MKALFVVLVLVAVGIVGLGFYRGWFSFSSNKTDDKTNVTFSVDKDKMKDDKDLAKEKVQDLGQTVKEKTGGPTDKVKETEKTKEPDRQP